MTKTRSPEYPAIGLKEAIEKARLVWSKDYQAKLPKKVMAEHMGYKSLSGASLPILSALAKYGLIEGRGDETRISNRAVAILAHPRGTPDRVIAIAEAAAAPDLFGELDAKFPQKAKASDAALRSYLLTQKFTHAAADAAIRAYRDTWQLVMEEDAGHTAEGSPMEASPMQPAQQPTTRPPASAPPQGAAALPYETAFTPGGGGEPFRVSFTGTGIEIAAKITSPDVADDLVRAVNALKLLLRPAGEAKKPAWADATFKPGDAVPASTPFHAQHVGHSGDALLEPEEGDTFLQCDKCGDQVRYTLA